jgi:hypothetical protein
MQVDQQLFFRGLEHKLKCTHWDALPKKEVVGIGKKIFFLLSWVKNLLPAQLRVPHKYLLGLHHCGRIHMSSTSMQHRRTRQGQVFVEDFLGSLKCGL